jgi:hypothetical protein
MRHLVALLVVLAGCGETGLGGPAACRGLDEAGCRARADCAVGSCPDCSGGTPFTGCYDPKLELGWACPAIACAPADCDQQTTEAACRARSECHPVYRDPGTCLCAQPGCCMMFDACADGAQANCKGPALCKSLPPTCEGQFTLGFANSCYEGCVKKSDCAP